jgi:hypothetical protein
LLQLKLRIFSESALSRPRDAPASHDPQQLGDGDQAEAEADRVRLVGDQGRPPATTQHSRGTAVGAARYLKPLKNISGVDVMITIFCDFDNFWRKICVFSKNPIL